MSKVMDFKVFRVLDANFNRAKEGLRVCEDICRFVYDYRSLTRTLKDIRHDLTSIMKTFKWKIIVQARDMTADVGKKSTITEMSRKSVEDVLFANLQRVKESVRVMEEMTKLLSKNGAENFKKLRYRIYRMERSFARKI